MKLRTALVSLSAVVAALLISVPAHATIGAKGVSCDRQVCVGYDGNKNGFYASATGFNYYGHVDLWGPGVSFRNSPTKQDPSASANGIGAGWLCAHGWKHENGNYIDMGFPCVEVK